MYTCVPPSLSERTLGKDSNRPRARQPEHQREREPTPGRLEGGRKETNLQRRRDWGEGACHCSSGTAVSAASQTKAQKAFSFSFSLSFLFSYLLSPRLFSFLTFKIEQLSFLFFPFKKVIFFLSTLLSILSFSFLFPSFSTLLSKQLDFFSLFLSRIIFSSFVFALRHVELYHFTRLAR